MLGSPHAARVLPPSILSHWGEEAGPLVLFTAVPQHLGEGKIGPRRQAREWAELVRPHLQGVQVRT